MEKKGNSNVKDKRYKIDLLKKMLNDLIFVRVSNFKMILRLLPTELYGTSN